MAAPQPTWGEVYAVPPTTTADDLLRLPEDGSTYELYEGVLVREMTSPGHADICQRLGVELGLYARTTGYANRILQNALFDLTPPGATRKTVLAPDLAIMRSGARPPWNVPHETPLLAVEVVSESQTLTELALKAQFYRNVGVDAVWIIDYKSRTVEVWQAHSTTTLHDTELLTSPLLPGFSVAVAFLLDG
ncbi:MAG: Uma2 family endonuclease [Ktedonobacterales bacterium]|nr:Uma2 family endonuclease [Ktedonobacterales bacterium]MBF6589750.1 Uma2 family endonuclease [Ktedonobacterales bacterium]